MQNLRLVLVRGATTLLFALTFDCSTLVPRNTVFPASPLSVRVTPTPAIIGTRQITKTNVKLMPLGDSITAGYPNSNGGYRISLQQLLNTNGYKYHFVGSQNTHDPAGVDLKHEGHDGWKIAQIDSIISSSLKRYEPDLILLMIGTNDMNSDASKARSYVAHDYKALLNHIFATKQSVKVIVSPIIYNRITSDEDTNTFNNALKSHVSSLASQGYYITFAASMSAQVPKAGLPDAVHPSDTLYARMAQVWMYYIQAITSS